MRNRLRRLQKAARGDLDWLDLRDGSRFWFKPMDAHAALFLLRMEAMRSLAGPDLSEDSLGCEPPREDSLGSASLPPYVSEIRAALASATPASRARFEDRYGPVEPEVGATHQDGSVTLRRVYLDGSASERHVEGEEAELLRLEAREPRLGTRW